MAIPTNQKVLSSGPPTGEAGTCVAVRGMIENANSM